MKLQFHACGRQSKVILIIGFESVSGLNRMNWTFCNVVLRLDLAFGWILS